MAEGLGDASKLGSLRALHQLADRRVTWGATVLGKPSHAFYELAVKGLGLDAEDVAMIGDDAEADVGGTMAAALMGVLVQTGKYRPAAALPHASDKVSQARLSSLSENCFVTTSEASP